jgi:cation diffusion facilitator CzcD-associated flavoprotein CzcO
MSAEPQAQSTNGGAASSDFDAIIVGAGFGGLRALHELRDKLGLSVRVLERGTNVGGTWYWNRYPGARTDSEAWVYCFSFDKDLEQEWDWQERFPQQREVERYMQHVVERRDMAKDIQFNTTVRSAVWDEAANRWTIETEAGECFTCTYFISASGLLHVALEPPFEGLDSFGGEWYMTSRWPKEPVSFEGKRVAVVGTGATAVQVIPEVAKEAEHLTVFQRTPNYVMPSRNHPLEENQRREIKRNYDQIWAQAEQQVFAFPMDPAGRVAADMTSPEQHRQVLEAGWEAGGFRFIFETFDDLLVDQYSNDVASEFFRQKIRAIVKDPETAELLCPTDHPLAGKRPPLGHFYYETYNRKNVSLVSVKENPIARITPKGVQLADGTEYEADIIIFALGFDAVTGALTSMEVHGRDGHTLKERWKDGAYTYLGNCVEGYPNMFMISGPQSPFANIPVVIDKTVEFIGRAVAHARENGDDRIEPTAEASQEWGRHCADLMNATIIIMAGENVRSWFLGANVEGKAHGVYFYFGGAAAYFGELKNEADGGFERFSLGRATVSV